MIAHDFTDDEALNRRMNARQAHLDRAETMKRRGQIILGGPLLTDDDKMNGSIIVYEANDEAELRGWLAEDPYVTGRVWNNIEIRRMKFTRLE
ncbi:hypothetical protein BDF22DRAFT_10284 [Syncephalis plumigaleata]|nr:hypothetical protein BDF22DRAFT_10284 [Syncephalis plumigaleata]